MIKLSGPKGRTIVYTVTDTRTGATVGQGTVEGGKDHSLNLEENQQVSYRYDETKRDEEGDVTDVIARNAADKKGKKTDD
jgi:hypothetical protein